MTTEIEVRTISDGEPMTFDVTVQQGDGHSRHRVTMSGDTWRRLGGGATAPDQCIEAAFRFLLEREPREAILAGFDVTVISRYFPEFDREFAGYLPR